MGKALTGNVPRGTSDEERDVKREMQLAALKHDLSTAKRLKDVVLGEIRLGARPEWVAMKYGHLGVTLERVLAAKAAIDKQEELKRERIESARGDREVPEVGQEPDGA